MKKLSARHVRILKMTHIIFFIMWFGGFLCITAVMFVAQPAHPDDIYMKCRTMEIIDNYVLIPEHWDRFLQVLYTASGPTGDFSNTGGLRSNG